MGTTLTDLNAKSGIKLLYTAIIEGCQYVLTNDDPEVAILAYSESNTSPYADDFTEAIGGLTIGWDTNQRLTPWKPFPPPCLVKLTVVPGLLPSTDVISDAFGTLVFKRTPANQSELRANVDCNDTSVTVARADDFPASGTLYIGGLEAASYSSRDTGTDVFTISQRGKYPATLTSTSARWARTVKPLTTSEQEAGVSPIVTSGPTAWVGRWVAIWVHRVVGGIPDTVEDDQSAAHCMFVGTIASVGQADGATVVECLDVRQKIYGARLMRDQFRAKVKEGVYLETGQTFTVKTSRNSTTIGTGTALTVVASGASGTNQINEGMFSAEELGVKIMAWLQGERAAARILFNLSYQALWASSAGTHGRIHIIDPTTTAGQVRTVILTFPSQHVSRFLGWDGEPIDKVATISDQAFESPSVPLRYSFGGGAFGALQEFVLTEPRGTWESQATLLPAALRDIANGIDGVLKVGDLGYVRAKRVSDTSFLYTEIGMGAFFPGQTDDAFDTRIKLNVDESTSIDVSQVLILESTFKTLLLQTLLTTGTGTFNHATYDVGTEGMGCGVPYSALGSDFVTELDSISGAADTLTCIVREPTSFHQMFEADFILRRAFLVWAGGRLRIKTWATPTSGYAALALDESSKAAPVGAGDKNRAAASEQADYYNLVTFRYNVDADGNYRDSFTLKDATSIRAHGERALEVKARNTFRQVGAVGSPIDGLLSEFAGFFPFTSKPWTVIRRTIDQNMLEQVYPGVVLTLTAKDIRSPETGLMYDSRTGTGGLSGYPGFVVGHRIDLGGPDGGVSAGVTTRIPSGEVDIMIAPTRTIPTYVPCAEVDETAPSAGYIAGTKVLTLKSHAHSESSEVADATRFVATDVVRVIEIDPVDPAAAQTWTDTVASQTGNTMTLTTGLAGYDTTGATLYRVIYAGYAAVTSTQKTKAYQADDADGMIVDSAQSYGFGFFGSSQSTSVTLSAATAIPSRYATNAYGDGVPFDVGYEQDAIRLADNLIHYKTSPQQPTTYSEVRDFTGAGTYQLVEILPFFVGRGEFTAGRTRLISLAPRIRSTSGATATVRVSAVRRLPSGSTRDDVTRIAPYTSVSFTTTSTTAVISTAQTLDISHIRLGDTLLGGVVWLLVEITTATEFTGFARLKLGAIA